MHLYSIHADQLASCELNPDGTFDLKVIKGGPVSSTCTCNFAHTCQCLNGPAVLFFALCLPPSPPLKLLCRSKYEPVFHYLFICWTPEISDGISPCSLCEMSPGLAAGVGGGLGGKRSHTGKQTNDKDGKSEPHVKRRLSESGCHFAEPSR